MPAQKLAKLTAKGENLFSQAEIEKAGNNILVIDVNQLADSNMADALESKVRELSILRGEGKYDGKIWILKHGEERSVKALSSKGIERNRFEQMAWDHRNFVSYIEGDSEYKEALLYENEGKGIVTLDLVNPVDGIGHSSIARNILAVAL
jgi:hypothetical protein